MHTDLGGAPLFIRLERGVPGEELIQRGYKVGWLSKAAQAKKAKKPPRLPRETPPMEQRRLSVEEKRRVWAEKARKYRERRKERLGIEAQRAEWRERHRKKKALVGTLTTQATDGQPATDAGQRPTTTEG